MSSGKEKQTEAVFNHHMQALFTAKDLDAVMEDYTEVPVQSVITG